MTAAHSIARRPGATALIAAALGLALLTTASAATAAAEPRCRKAACRETVTVGPTGIRFRSDERFQPGVERVVVRLYAGGDELVTLWREGELGCRRHLRGSGIRAIVSVCGAETPIRVTARRPAGIVRMEIVYRARPRRQAVLGSSGSFAGSGGLPAPASGGVSARRG